LLNYQWPGNIRELENMMKRFVVLQDEQFIMTELARLNEAEPVRAAALVAVPPVPATRRSEPLPMPPLPVIVPERDPDLASLDGDGDSESGVDLQGLIKAASLRVEREAIEQALSRFRWNRRRAAAYLQVSYKTLLNKMKECGISDPPPPEARWTDRLAPTCGRGRVLLGRAHGVATRPPSRIRAGLWQRSCTFSR
jgi:two-component system response regulator AtoC